MLNCFKLNSDALVWNILTFSIKNMLEAKLERTSWTYLQQILELSQMPEYQDIIIICKDDKISLNCFLLASIFPVIQKCLKGANISGRDCQKVNFFGMVQENTMAAIMVSV